MEADGAGGCIDEGGVAVRHDAVPWGKGWKSSFRAYVLNIVFAIQSVIIVQKIIQNVLCLNASFFLA